jgi:hypothetical protein
MEVLEAKSVTLALVKYKDERNQEVTQLAVVGDNHVHLLETRALGMSARTTPQGVAQEWLAKGIFEKMGIERKSPPQEEPAKGIGSL